MSCCKWSALVALYLDFDFFLSLFPSPCHSLMYVSSLLISFLSPKIDSYSWVIIYYKEIIWLTTLFVNVHTSMLCPPSHCFLLSLETCFCVLCFIQSDLIFCEKAQLLSMSYCFATNDGLAAHLITYPHECTFCVFAFCSHINCRLVHIIPFSHTSL